MKNKGLIMILLGTVLLLAAVSLVIYNISEDRNGGKYAQSALTIMLEEMPETRYATTTATTAYSEDLFAEYETTTTTTIADDVVMIEDRPYIGMIEVPSQQIQLPVLQDWNKEFLQYAPCRYSGSPKTNSLVLAGHNYTKHFGKLFSVNVGDPIYFTDVNGLVYQYAVTYVEVLEGGDIEGMLDQDMSRWDLTLFTCTLSGQSRMTVRAERVMT
ncbi:MAG: sortase [Oscillospiraceae bacterium]|nr:sortase [Oscillospiraceae bacterium]